MRSCTLLAVACLCCSVACRAPGESAPVETSALKQEQPAEPDVATVETASPEPAAGEAEAVGPMVVEPVVPEPEPKERTPEERLAEIERRTRWLEENRRARTELRENLHQEAAKNPGWEVYQSENYFYLTDLDDDSVIEELMVRAELVRMRLLQQFPPQTPIGGANFPSNTVIRVFHEKSSYHEYGGPGGSSAYYADFHKEAAVVLDKRFGDAWSGLQHILVHEYFLNSLGLKTPPPWLLYGLSELYSALRLERDRLVLPAKDKRLLNQALNEEHVIPLAELMRYTSSQFRGNNSRGLSAYSCVLQAWSVVFFLTVGEEDSAYWDPAWEGLLERSVEAAVQTEGNEEQLDAINATLAEVDLDALEAVWRAWLRQRWLAGHPKEAEAKR